MPFVSQAQRRFMYAQHPDIAKRWEAETPHGSHLPQHVPHRKKKRHHMSEPKLGSGARFRRLASALAHDPNVRDPNAVAAAAGRKKYGKARFQRLAAAGRRH